MFNPTLTSNQNPRLWPGEILQVGFARPYAIKKRARVNFSFLPCSAILFKLGQRCKLCLKGVLGDLGYDSTSLRSTLHTKASRTHSVSGLMMSSPCLFWLPTIALSRVKLAVSLSLSLAGRRLVAVWEGYGESEVAAEGFLCVFFPSFSSRSLSVKHYCFNSWEFLWDPEPVSPAQPGFGKKWTVHAKVLRTVLQPVCIAAQTLKNF